LGRRVQLSVAFLFDTDAISEVMKPWPDEGYLAWPAAVPRDDKFASAITIGELFYGAYRTQAPARQLELLASRILPAVTVLPFDTDVAHRSLDAWGTGSESTCRLCQRSSSPMLGCRARACSTVRITSDTAVARDRQRRQFRYCASRVATLGMPQVPVLLQTEPEGSTRAGHLLETQRRVGGHPSPATDDAVETRERDAELSRERDLADAQRPQELLEQDLPRMRRRSLARESTAAALSFQRSLSDSP
jgi:hypothetical protein